MRRERLSQMDAEGRLARSSGELMNKNVVLVTEFG